MNVHFQPTRPDGRSFRDVAVDALKNEPKGTLISYESIGVALGLNPKRDLQKIQAAVRAANKLLLEFHSRGLKNVPCSGYRILPANEHAIVARGHQDKAIRQVRMSVAIFDGADLDEMTPSHRKIHEGLSMIAQNQLAMHTYNKTRFDRLEALFKGPIVDQK